MILNNFLLKNIKMNIVPNRDLDFSGIPRDSNLRNKFNDIVAESDFEQTLIRLLPKYLPVSFIEGFALVQKIAEPYVAPGLYFSPNSQSNTTYNFAAATAVDRLGAHIVTSQHGGGDGQFQILFSEYLARRCSDYYISFGWQDSYYDGATVVPFSSAELSRMVKRNQTKVVNVKGLFVSTTGNPYFYRGDHWASMGGFEIYFNDQLAFLGHLENNIRNHMKYRPYPPNNLGWEETLDRLRERFPEILVVENENIVDALNTAKIIVIDHNITTLLKAMAMNRPVVCYWQPLLYPFRTECVADFEKLREVGILYDNPESAAQHVNSIWQKIDGWWQSDSVQKARNTFVAKYARTTTDVAIQWRAMLLRIARDAQTNTSPITGQKRRV